MEFLESLDVWKLLSGLGIFLFGIFLMEESLERLTGRAFKKLIRASTRGKFRSVLTGAVSTAVLQSSSAISLMVLAFVGAGILELSNAIGVVLGANMGTTFTGWLVALIGFKIEIESFALPLIGIGGLGIIFLGKSDRYSNISKLVVGFGFLFLGLSYMKVSVEGVADQIDLTGVAAYGILPFFGIGILLSGLMQSSSASIAIVLTTINSGIISFEAGAAAVAGANIGTTITIILGALRGSQNKKRVAWSHFFYNLITAILALALLYPLSMLIQDGFGLREDPVTGIALFHTIFNLIGVLVFIPFLGKFSRMLIRIFPDKRPKLALFLHNAEMEVASASIEAARKETYHLFGRALHYNLHFMGITPHDEAMVQSLPIPTEAMRNSSVEADFQQLLLLQADIMAFIAHTQEMELDQNETESLQNIAHAARMAVYSCRTLRDVQTEFDQLDLSDNARISETGGQFRDRMESLYERMLSYLDNPENSDAQLKEIMEQVKENDRKFVSQAIAWVGTKAIQGDELPQLLLVNRAIYQSQKELHHALRDLA